MATFNFRSLRSTLTAAIIFLMGTNLPAQTLCSDLMDPFAGFPDIGPFGYCIPSSPGALGGPAAVDLNGLSFPVPVGGRIDILSTYTSWIDVPEGSPVNVSTTFSWPTPVDPASLQASEFAVNLLLDPIQFMQLGDSIADPPGSIELTLDGGGNAIGWTFNGQIDSMGWPEGIERFHLIASGLTAGDVVKLSHQVTGGLVVVPEPSGGVLLLIGLAAMSTNLRRRSKFKASSRTIRS
jgi:hypothetical protein